MFCVQTQRAVRVYDLVKQELVRKLLTGAQWVSALAVHPKGDNLLVASYDRKCMWYVALNIEVFYVFLCVCELISVEMLILRISQASWSVKKSPNIMTLKRE